MNRFRVDGENIAFLGFVAPDFHGRHCAIGAWNPPQFQFAAMAAIIEEFRQRIGQAARPNVMNRENRVVLTQCPAGIYHFLATPLHFRITALHGSKIQFFLTLPAAH